MTSREQRKYWLQNERYKAKFIRKYAKAFKKSIREQITPLIDYLPLAPNPEAVLNAIPTIMKPDGITATFQQLYNDVGLSFAERMYTKVKGANNPKKEMGQEFEYIWSNEMFNYVNGEAGIYITSIIATSQNVAIRIVQDIVAQAIDEGLSIPNTMELLEKRIPIEWRKMAIWRSELIARTEVLTASNYGSDMGVRSINDELGLDLRKVWLATIDNRTRDAHREENGKTASLNGTFTVGGKQMQRPGDPRGGAENRCNCRCTLIYERADGKPAFSV
jgi:hypothetical protein